MCEISGENAGWVDESPTVFERPVRSCVGVGHDPNWN